MTSYGCHPFSRAGLSLHLRPQRRSHGVPRVDDRRVVSGIIYVIKHGLQWKDAPDEYGPHKALYNRFVRWSRLGVFNKFSLS